MVFILKQALDVCNGELIKILYMYLNRGRICMCIFLRELNKILQVLSCFLSFFCMKKGKHELFESVYTLNFASNITTILVS